MRMRCWSVGIPVVLIGLFSVAAQAGGIGVEFPLYMVDLTRTLANVPVAVQGAFAEIEDALADLGMPPAELATLSAQFDQALSDVEQGLAAFPSLIPVPHLGGSIEFSLPLGVVDGLRFSGGVLNDQILRGIGGLFEFSFPQPLVEVEVEEDGFAASFAADVSFSSFVLSTDLVKRLDLVIAAIDFGLGVAMIQGSVTPAVDYDVPPQFQDGAAAALEALRLNELHWSAFGVHGLVGFELGPPFLRLVAEGRFFLPVSQSTGWWEILVGSFTGSMGLVIRF